jgi:death on curing protein
LSWVWVEEDEVLFGHELVLEATGGSGGVRDLGGIQSALARPQNLAGYGNPDLADLAAAYTAGLCQNHGFVDGNKRIAFLIGVQFLKLNRYRVEARQEEVVAAVLSLADQGLSEAGYANWLRDHMAKNEPGA